MTTIHAALRGAKQPSGRYLSLTLQNGATESIALIAPRDELRQALIETGGVGRFDLQIGHDPTIHHAIAKEVEKGDAPDSINNIVVQEVSDNDIVRMQVLIKVRDLPPAAKERRAQVVQKKRHLTVRGVLNKIPEYVVIDLSDLDVNDVLTAGKVRLPEGIELVTPESDEIFICRELIKPG